MNFQQLEYVVALHHLGHFGKAAESCHVTQATLSGMIKKLEEELGYTLFDRSHQPIRTTEQGILFLNKAKNILNEKRKMYEIEHRTHALEGEIRIGVIPTIASSLLPHILLRVQDEHPKLRVIVSELTTDTIVSRLLSNQLDIGILVTPLDNEHLSEYILYYESMLVYGVNNTTTEYVTSDQLMHNKVWLLEEGHCFRNQSVEICNIKPKKEEDKIVFNGSSFETLINLTDTFGGITLVPELYCNSMSSEKISKTRAFNKPVPVREVSIVSYRPYVKQSSITYLSDLIKATIAPMLSTYDLHNEDMAVIGIR